MPGMGTSLNTIMTMTMMLKTTKKTFHKKRSCYRVAYAQNKPGVTIRRTNKHKQITKYAIVTR